ncbi:MAG: acetyl-CoA carboxylase biotin carboxyl carrier protein [Myxococcales bacterium]|nr:acetyl-CoA carboxylase biotin carboxyl carrier protein [Myxococcales bacterium]
MAKDAKPQDPKTRTLADVRALARVLRQYDLSEIEVEREGERIRICRESTLAAGHAVVGAAAALAPAAAPAAPDAGAAKEAVDDGSVIVTSPFVGTFYRAPSPDSPPFVEVNQEVAKGTTLCIVEAMKLMNEIEAESDFKIVEILVKNGEPVEFGQALFKVLPS